MLVHALVDNTFPDAIIGGFSNYSTKDRQVLPESDEFMLDAVIFGKAVSSICVFDTDRTSHGFTEQDYICSIRT